MERKKASGRFLLLTRLLLIGCWALFAGCQEVGQETQPPTSPRQVVFTPKYATHFWIEQWKEHDILCTIPFQDSQDTLRFGLYPKTEDPPSFPKGVKAVATPVNATVTLSATHIGFLKAIDEVETIKGLSYPDYVFHPAVRAKLAKGLITDIGVEGGMSNEVLLSMQPDLIMASVLSAVGYHKDFATLMDAGLTVFPNAEWIESSVLGRAEWVIALGALYGKQEMAQRYFQQVDSSYRALAAIGHSAVRQPHVIGGLPYKGVWSIAGGNSYIVKMLKDAGGSWPWAADTSAVSLPLDFEAVYPIALEAPFWIRTGQAYNIEALLSFDRRFQEFASVQSGDVYNYHRRLAPNGLGNDYWESGVVEPQVLLADLIKILHPEKLPEHDLVYYQKLE